ncbi:MAG: HNH endonuclease [Candidatus Eremiobacteraeota bacterium]|nr:HNH endonuclease [Candidatus Eremiobacteraeota bacterium]
MLRIAAGAQMLPNNQLTPGAVATASAADVCLPYYSSRHVRHVSTQLKHQVYVEYFGNYRRGYVIDHLVPREIGGADELRNLWPQPRAESKVKDRIENRARFEVCDEHRPLSDAQRAFMRDWRSAAQWGPHPR